LLQWSSRDDDTAETPRRHAGKQWLEFKLQLARAADTLKRELQQNGRCRPDGAALPRRSQTKAGEFLVWDSIKMSRYGAGKKCGSRRDFFWVFERGEFHAKAHGRKENC